MIELLKYLFICFFPFPLFSKSLESMGRAAEQRLSHIGSILLVAAIVYAGLLFLKNGAEGKQKLFDVITGAICILGAGAIVSLIRSIVG